MTVKARLRHLAGRLVGWGFETAGGPPPGLVPGAADPALDTRPVVVVVLLGAAEAAVAATAADLAASLADGGPRAVLLIDSPHFAAARRAGVVCDHVLSAQDWEARGYERPWPSHLEAQIERLRRDLGSRDVLRLPPEGSRAMTFGAFQSCLEPTRTYGRVGGLLVRLERRVDHPAGGW